MWFSPFSIRMLRIRVSATFVGWSMLGFAGSIARERVAILTMLYNEWAELLEEFSK
jgi:hypothetical protein